MIFIFIQHMKIFFIRFFYLLLLYFESEYKTRTTNNKINISYLYPLIWDNDKFHNFNINFSKVSKNGSALSKSSHRPTTISHPSNRFIEMEFEGVESAGKHERRRKEGQTKKKKKKKKENGERKSMKRTFLANILLIGIACKQSTEIFEGTESNGL